ncbi:GAF domain-containing sensor histidine kinase [Daejeonella lutea]|nr:ATP-binding protein [Daejeonella lutea]
MLLNTGISNPIPASCAICYEKVIKTIFSVFAYINAMENTFGINIIPDNDVKRIGALRRYQILDTPPEDAFDNVARLCTQIFNVPISLISLVDKEEVYFKANVGMGNAKKTSRGVSLCSLAVLKPDVTVFENAGDEPCLLTNPNVTGSFGLKFYAGAPLTTHDGFLIGTLCIIDKQPRSFGEDEQKILSGMAKIVMDEVELRLSSLTEIARQQEVNEELTAINEEMTSTNEELSSTLEDLALSQNRLAVAHDEVKESMDRLDLALEAGRLGSYNLNLETGRMICTPLCKQNFGLTPDAQFDFKEFLNSILPDYRDYVQEKINDAVKNNKTYIAEYEILWPDSSRHWISASGKLMKDRETGANRMIGVTLLITERKEFEQRKDDFIGIASHELKTPITSLKANLQMLDRLKNNPNSQLIPRLVEASNNSMDKLEMMVEDLLNMHQFKEGHLRLNKTLFNVAEMLDVCCNHIRFGGKYDLITTGDKDVILYADEHRIDQVIVNFVNNAVKYAPGSGQIILHVEKLEHSTKISVQDFGPGIPPEHQTRLFDRYWRADHSGSKYSGLGIGLYICSEIIRQHGGEIGVESQIGNGSTFWFTIPDEN